MGFPTHSPAVAILLLGVASSALAQAGRLSRPRASFELGMALPALIVDDAGGTQLKSGLAPVLGATGAWTLSPRVMSTLGIRASSAALAGDHRNTEWDAGRTTQVDIQLGLEQRLARGFAIAATVGPTWLLGPEDVVPFRDAQSPLHWGGSVGMSWRVMQSRPVSATLRMDGFMAGGASVADPVAEPAWIRRFVIGARYGS
jgi:hypothetical protein